MRHVIAIALPMFLACSASPAGVAPLDSGITDDGGTADAKQETGTNDAMGDDDSGPNCAQTKTCSGSPKSGQTCVASLAGTTNDASGPAISGLTVFVCGTDICTSPIKTDASGKISDPICIFMKQPAIKVFDDPPADGQWAAFAALLTGSGPGYDVGALKITKLPATGADIPAGGGDATSGGVTLTVASGVTIGFDFEHPSSDPESQKFRAVRVPVANLPLGLATGVDDAFALAPLNTTLKPAATVTVPNSNPAWGPGSAVDFYLNGTDTSTATPPAPWGQWGKIGTGAVSSNGQSIVLDVSAGGLPEIAMVGVKKQ